MKQKKSDWVARGLIIFLLFFCSYFSVSFADDTWAVNSATALYTGTFGQELPKEYIVDSTYSRRGLYWYPWGIIIGEDISLGLNLAFPLGGSLTFNSGSKLLLLDNNDLILTGAFSIIGDAKIYGYGNAMVLGGDLDLNYTITFIGDTIIDGRGNFLDIGDGYLWVDSNKTLTLRNLVLKNLHDSNLVMEASTSQLVLDNVCIWLDNDYSFTQGRLFFYDDVIISGSPHTFSYKTTESSYIVGQTKLTIDHGVTFSYDPAEAHRDLINMEDATSYLCLDGCSLYSTPTGLRFTKGAVLFDNLVTLSADGDGIGDGIVFGGGVDDDVTTKVLSGARVEAYGHISFIV